MSLIEADLSQSFHGTWTWARTGRNMVDLGGSMLDIRFIIIKTYLTAIWGCSAHGFVRRSTQLIENGYKPMGTGAANRCIHLQYPAKQQRSKPGDVVVHIKMSPRISAEDARKHLISISEKTVLIYDKDVSKCCWCLPECFSVWAAEIHPCRSQNVILLISF